MLGKIKNLGLRWKFGVVVFIVLVVVMSIPVYILKGALTRKLDVFYGAPETKGFFVADLLVNELKPLLAQNVDAQNVQQTVQQKVNDYYKTVYGMYSVRYILVQDGDFVLASTFPDVVPQVVFGQNSPSEKRECKAWDAKDRRYSDCAVPLNFSKEKPGAVRVGILQQNPKDPLLEKLKTAQISGVFGSIFLWVLLIVIIVTVGVTLAFWYFVLRRIAFLGEVTEKMSFADFKTVIPIKSNDEIGALEEALERIRVDFPDAIERAKRRKS